MMKKTTVAFAVGIVFALAPITGSAQYSIDRFVIAGGGGASSGGGYTLTGTVGQAEASDLMSGGSYDAAGGFWYVMEQGPIVIDSPTGLILY